jgi:hypothetical protein
MRVFFLLDFNSENFAESCNKITFASALIQPPNATVGLCQFFPPLQISAYPLL